jgi:hypothetical protein
VHLTVEEKMESFTLLDLLLKALASIPPEKLEQYQYKTETK